MESDTRFEKISFNSFSWELEGRIHSKLFFPKFSILAGIPFFNAHAEDFDTRMGNNVILWNVEASHDNISVKWRSDDSNNRKIRKHISLREKVIEDIENMNKWETIDWVKWKEDGIVVLGMIDGRGYMIFFKVQTPDIISSHFVSGDLKSCLDEEYDMSGVLVQLPQKDSIGIFFADRFKLIPINEKKAEKSFTMLPFELDPEVDVVPSRVFSDCLFCFAKFILDGTLIPRTLAGLVMFNYHENRIENVISRPDTCYSFQVFLRDRKEYMISSGYHGNVFIHDCQSENKMICKFESPHEQFGKAKSIWYSGVICNTYYLALSYDGSFKLYFIGKDIKLKCLREFEIHDSKGDGFDCNPQIFGFGHNEISVCFKYLIDEQKSFISIGRFSNIPYLKPKSEDEDLKERAIWMMEHIFEVKKDQNLFENFGIRLCISNSSLELNLPRVFLI